MRKINIDLSSPSLRRTLFRTPYWARALGLAVAAIMPLIFASYSDYSEARHRYDIQIASARTRYRATTAIKSRSQQPQLSPEKVASINAAIMQINLPWRGLHDAVQSATPPSVALLALEPDAKKRSLRITAEVKNSDDMFGYLESVKAPGWFTSATLVRHEINDQDPNHPIRFQIDAEWSQP